MLEISGVSKSFSAHHVVLDGVSLSLAQGQTLALTGESGSGKSTLLHLAAGLDQPDRGSIRFNGHDLAALDDAARAELRRREIGLVFQQFNLVPSLNVEANIALQARLAGRFEAEFSHHLSERLGLTDLLGRYPEQLSGGQQQRVAIARALCPKPRLILADEPTGNLDEVTGEEVFALFRSLVAETEAAFLMVTHSIQLAGQLDRRIHLSRGKISEA